VAVGVDVLFLEVHPDPDQALLRQLLSLREAIAGGVAGSSL
jgi:3-deoxy-D-manno-octulosonic acid (KDO) 8-phosphate synthase